MSAENVECPTCRGSGAWVKFSGTYPCPDCTPGNVDTPITQLDMQCRMALLETRRQFTDARLRARRWEPRPSPWWDLAPEDVPADD